METEDVPLLTLGPIAVDFQYAQFLHGIFVCKCSSHFTRGCPVRFAGPALREDDSLVNALLTTREEEPEGQRGLLERLWQ